tara:strand:- start:23713 stop:23880 length:168 start_codon:yes stop_codon:yes gene_type:complete
MVGVWWWSAADTDDKEKRFAAGNPSATYALVRQASDGLAVQSVIEGGRVYPGLPV